MTEKEEPKTLTVHELEPDCWYRAASYDQRIVHVEAPGRYNLYDGNGVVHTSEMTQLYVHSNRFVKIDLVSLDIKFKDAE